MSKWSWKISRIKWKAKRWLRLPFVMVSNYILVKQYPFLKPSCGWHTDMTYWEPGYKYHYEETWLDGLPKGWRKEFGERMCGELKRAIEQYHLDNYKIHQVKEKFGTMCWYSEGGNEITSAIVEHYAGVSTRICSECGLPAFQRNSPTGWVVTMCKHCFNKIYDTCTIH